jgi:competence protein ComEA
MKSPIKNYLSITKREWNGIVVLIVLIALIFAAPYVYQLFRKDNIINTKDFNAAVAMLDKAKKSQAGDSQGNTDEQPDSKAVFYKKASPGVVIELNSADSVSLTSLHGIGASFARRIISYRNRLGGFYNEEQLREVFGMDSIKYADLQAQIKVDPSLIKKIKVNKVTFDNLSHFPYLSYKQMNAIIQFREQHGEYESLADMKNIAILDDKTLNKIKPYIAFK